MARTTQQQLDDLDAAIAKVETQGQAYEAFTGRKLTRADLGTMYDERKDLVAKIEREARGGVKIRTLAPRF